MQDKDIHIDNKFTDKGWAEMRKLLDQEMPAANRRRFAIWWVFLLLGALMATIAAAVWYQIQPRQQPIKIERPVAQVPPVETEKGQKPDKSNIAESGSKDVAGPSAPGKAVVNPITYPQHTTSTKSQLVETGFIDLKASNASSTLPALFFKTNEITVNATVDNIQPKNALDGAVVEDQYETPMPLPVTETKMLPFEAGFESRLKENTIATQSLVKLSAYMGGMATPMSLANGLNAGLDVGIPIGEKGRISIEGGTGYAFIQQPLYVTVAQGVNPTTVPTTEVNEEVLVSLDNKQLESEEASFNSITKASESLQLHYAQFPWRLKFRVAPRFNVHGGFNIGILLASSPGFTEGGLLSTPGKSIGDQYNLADADQLASSSIILSKIDYSAIAGVSYRMNSRLDIDFRYQAGINDLIKSNTEKEYNRFFNLSLHYRIFGKN